MADGLDVLRPPSPYQSTKFGGDKRHRDIASGSRSALFRCPPKASLLTVSILLNRQVNPRLIYGSSGLLRSRGRERGAAFSSLIYRPGINRRKMHSSSEASRGVGPHFFPTHSFPLRTLAYKYRPTTGRELQGGGALPDEFLSHATLCIGRLPFEDGVVRVGMGYQFHDKASVAKLWSPAATRIETHRCFCIVHELYIDT